MWKPFYDLLYSYPPIPHNLLEFEPQPFVLDFHLRIDDPFFFTFSNLNRLLSCFFFFSFFSQVTFCSFYLRPVLPTGFLGFILGGGFYDRPFLAVFVLSSCFFFNLSPPFYARFSVLSSFDDLRQPINCFQHHHSSELQLFVGDTMVFFDPHLFFPTLFFVLALFPVSATVVQCPSYVQVPFL